MTDPGKRKLFIGGLPSECDEKALGNAFSRWETEDGKLNSNSQRIPLLNQFKP
jgi:hypothetical protein